MNGAYLAAIGIAVIILAVIIIQVQMNSAQIANDLIEQPSSNSTIKVIASFYPLYEFAKNVGGNRIEISSFVPLGVEPHDWEPSAGDVLKLKAANLFIYNGGGFEPYVEKLVNSNEYDNVLFVEMMKNVELIKMDEHADAEHDLEYDPHIWLDPVLAKQQVKLIKNSLSKMDPKNADYYEQNAASYASELDKLDTKIRNGLSSCKNDTFMPFHNAFSYFAVRYNLEVFPLSGISPESEATAAELKRFVDFAKKHDVKVIFSEDLIDPRLAQTLADEAGIQTMVLSPIEGLSEKELRSGVTYISKMEENLQNLKIALECQ